MNRIAFTLVCIISVLTSYSQNINTNCFVELDANQISKIELLPFSNSSNKIDFLHTFQNYVAKYYPEMETSKVDYKIRNSDVLIFDVYGFVDKTKIENLICNFRKDYSNDKPEKIIILFREFDNGKIVIGLEIVK